MTEGILGYLWTLVVFFGTTAAVFLAASLIEARGYGAWVTAIGAASVGIAVGTACVTWGPPIDGRSSAAYVGIGLAFIARHLAERRTVHR